MTKKLQLAAAAIFLAVFSFAQAPVIGTPQWAAAHSTTNNTSNHRQNPYYSPQNGNDTLNTIYSNTACGLNYVLVSQRLEQRVAPIGIAQPAPYNVIIPPCAVIQQAYLYTEALGVAPSITATLTDPSNVSTVYNMTNIGNSVDVCWGMNGTHVWRSDVTASITSAGTYMLSGLPTSTTASMTSVDCEGATLLVIYTDPTASYTGTLNIDDGCHTVLGNNLVHNMTGFNACANSTYASDFMLVGDMQMMGYTLTMNGSAVTQPVWNWWNEIDATTSVTSGQTSCSYTLQDPADCYTLAVAGLYFQTGCSTCIPAATNISLSTTTTADNCNGNGSATVTATGGNGNYTYLWSPGGNTTAAPTNMAGGTYTVYVTDGSSCTSAVVVVPYTGMNLTMSSTNVTCSAAGSATISVTGGTGPYTYSWAPSGGTGATASNLTPGNYTVTVIDNTGCTMIDSANIINTATLVGSIYSAPDTCGNGVGSATVYANGGQGPYTYLWSVGNQTTSTITGLSAGIYTCTITDNLGCTVSVTGTVFNLASPTVNIIGNSTIYCGDSVTLYAAANMAVSYSWSPSTGLSSTTVQMPVCTTTVTTTYTCTVTSACGVATDTFTVFVDTTNLYVEQICFVTVDTTLNKNQIIWERWNSPASGAYNIYRESSPGVYTLVGSQPISQFSTFTDMTSNPTVNADRYVITTTDACGQESDTSFHHRTINLQTTVNGNGFDLNWNAYEGLPIATYNIYRGSSNNTMTLINSVAGNILTYNDPNPPVGQTLYMIEAVHPFGGCNPSRLTDPNALDNVGSFSNINNTDPAGISENFSGNNILITPNPGNGNFQLTISLSTAQEISMNVFDNVGRNVYSENKNAAAGNFVSTMDLTSLSAGVYFVQVKTANGSGTKRLVIE